MRGAGAGDNDVGGFKRTAAAVAVGYGNLGPGGKRKARPFRNRLIDVDGSDSPLRADDLGKDRSVIACAAAKMQQMIIDADAKPVELESP